MEYRKLGQTGMDVSALCLGTMNLGAWGNTATEAGVGLVHHAIDCGINFIDTADVYSKGQSEEIIGEALRGGLRKDVILATKFYFSVDEGPLVKYPRPNTSGYSKRHIIAACEASLKRLGTDWIDLYQIHEPDYTADLDEALGALSDLVRAGKVRAIGSSSFPADLLADAHWLARARARERVRCEQPQYSIFVRTIERDVLPACQKYGLGAIVWSPLNGGWLSGARRRAEADKGVKSRRARLIPKMFDLGNPDNARKFDLVESLEQLAREAGISLAQLAVAWTLEHPAVNSSIIGPRNLEQLGALLPATTYRVPVDVLDEIDRLVPPGTIVAPAADDRREVPWLKDPALRRRALPSNIPTAFNRGVQV